MATGATGATRRRGGARPGAFVENGRNYRLVKSSGHSPNSIGSEQIAHCGYMQAHVRPTRALVWPKGLLGALGGVGGGALGLLL